MTKKSQHEHKFTGRVHARTQLAKALLDPKHANLIATNGLLVTDLSPIKSMGEEAQRHDTAQQSDLVLQRNALGDLARKWSEISGEEDALRRRLPAVVDDLSSEPATRELAEWLAKIGFERYRLRSSIAAPAEGSSSSTSETIASASPAAGPTRERVVRTDRLSAALQISTFSAALLEKERAPIVAAFEARAFSRDRLTQLAADSQAIAASLGAVQLTSPEAGRLESEAVAVQKQCWDSCRRMIREAVVGDPDLERLWAMC